MIIFGIISFKNEHDSLKKKLNKKVIVFADQLSLGLIMPLWNYDRIQVSNLIKSIMKDNDIYAIVFIPSGKETTPSIYTRDSSGVVINSNEIKMQKDIYEISRKIYYSKYFLGEFKIFVTHKFINIELLRYLFSIILIIIILDILLVAGIISVLWTSIIKPLGKLENYAKKVSEGNDFDIHIDKITHIKEIYSLYTSIRKMVTLLRNKFIEVERALKEKELLILEIQHRLKNNLNVIISLLEFQKSSIKNSTMLGKIKSIEERIFSIALIHNLLYKSKSLDKINFKNYLFELTENLLSSYGYLRDIMKIDFNIDEYELNINQIKSLGLIINELLTNSLKYAFKNKCFSNKIEIFIDNNESSYILKISDNGIGLPNNINIDKTNSSGLFLVKLLCEEINGFFEIKSDGGTIATIKFIKKGNYE